MDGTKMKKLLFIVNPYSGKKIMKNQLMNVIQTLNQNDYEVTLYTTCYQGHATEISSTALPYDEVLCAGGDGTLNEVINGLLRNDIRKPLGYIPCGSTNDFANSLGLPNVITKSLDVFLHHDTTFVDAGKFEDRFFTYVASFGAFTQASYATPQAMKNNLGYLAYLLETPKYINSIKPTHIIATIDDNQEVIEGDYIFGGITNSKKIGGIIKINAAPDFFSDGKFELVLLKKPKDLGQLNQLINAVNTMNYDKCDCLVYRKISKVTIQSDEIFPWTLDGERVDGKNSISIENRYHALDLHL